MFFRQLKEFFIEIIPGFISILLLVSIYSGIAYFLGWMYIFIDHIYPFHNLLVANGIDSKQIVEYSISIKYFIIQPLRFGVISAVILVITMLIILTICFPLRYFIIGIHKNWKQAGLNVLNKNVSKVSGQK